MKPVVPVRCPRCRTKLFGRHMPWLTTSYWVRWCKACRCTVVADHATETLELPPEPEWDVPDDQYLNLLTTRSSYLVVGTTYDSTGTLFGTLSLLYDEAQVWVTVIMDTDTIDGVMARLARIRQTLEDQEL